MPKEVVAALIGIAGVIVSAFVSWMVSKSQVRAETKKLRLEMQHAYLENLHRARLDGVSRTIFSRRGAREDYSTQGGDT